METTEYKIGDSVELIKDISDIDSIIRKQHLRFVTISEVNEIMDALWYSVVETSLLYLPWMIKGKVS